MSIKFGKPRAAWLAMAVLPLLTACASVPEQFKGEFYAVTPRQVRAQDIGQEVRWGGVILETNASQHKTCFEILSRDLDRSMRPVNEDATNGRFIACKPGFHDPEVFKKGREVTLTGRIAMLDVRKVGEFDYQYPVVNAGFITMWPERSNVVIYDYYDPFFYPYYWGPYYYPYYYPYPYYRPHPHPHPRPSGGGQRTDIPDHRNPESAPGPDRG